MQTMVRDALAASSQGTPLFPPPLTPRWFSLRPHWEQYRLWNSGARFRVVTAGRRSGKTELGKRFLATRALEFEREDGWFVLAAPTHAQAKRIFWKDIKALIPKRLRMHRPNESELTLTLLTGTEITVIGLDAPERLEGRTLDGILVDEMGNTKPEVWKEHIRPALSTPGRPGWAWLIGVPEGRNHYYNLALYAQRLDFDDWDYFTWHSSTILDPSEIKAAMEELDLRSYNQEYGGEFVDIEGRAYYCFDRGTHAIEPLRRFYNPKADLIFAFDFNVSPGVAVIAQECFYKGRNPDIQTERAVTMVLGEVWIEHGSNTPMVCNKLAEDWGGHQGDILLYGDASGGAKGTAKVEGSDWDLIPRVLSQTFPGRLRTRVKKKNPAIKARVNAMNSRLMTTDANIHMVVDPERAPHVVLDLEGVAIKKGSAGELEKDVDPSLTHISDALGYYIAEKFPVRTATAISKSSI